MTALHALQWGMRVAVLERSRDVPAADVADVTLGDIALASDVFAFGKHLDVVTCEIEHVSVEGLQALQAAGVHVRPQPDVLACVQDKGTQRTFFAQHGIQGPGFQLFSSAQAIRAAVEGGTLALPFVQKLRTHGYDGRGVVLARTKADLATLLEGASLVEDLVPIRKELAVLVARRPSGERVTYPPVEMMFDHGANLMLNMLAPAQVPPHITARAQHIAEQASEALNVHGLLAVELFWTEHDDVLLNEVAPRPHNSGHHTLESCATSQFEQFLRCILDLPLGPPTMHVAAAATINLLGTAHARGTPTLKGLAETLAAKGHLHMYGKRNVKPWRKMGHITLVGDSPAEVSQRAMALRGHIRVDGDAGSR